MAVRFLRHVFSAPVVECVSALDRPSLLRTTRAIYDWKVFYLDMRACARALSRGSVAFGTQASVGNLRSNFVIEVHKMIY